MSVPKFERGIKAEIEGKEILIPGRNLLRHVLSESIPGEDVRVLRIPTHAAGEMVFESKFFLANIGTRREPILLELRFEDTDHDFSIALLMTNERYPHDLEVMAERLMAEVDQRGVEYDAVAAPASLGSFLAQEIARKQGPYTPVLTFQKGKPAVDGAGNLRVGPPKPWVAEEAGVEVSSGTSHQVARQKLYLDQKIAALASRQGWRILFVDDAMLTQGTATSVMALADSMKLRLAAFATVLNEAAPSDEFMGMPYVALTKLPVFDRTDTGYKPRPNSFRGLENFYVEI